MFGLDEVPLRCAGMQLTSAQVTAVGTIRQETRPQLDYRTGNRGWSPPWRTRWPSPYGRVAGHVQDCLRRRCTAAITMIQVGERPTGARRLRNFRAWRAAVAFPGGSASSTLAATLPAGYLMIVTAIDAPVPVELIRITACALPFAASKWALQRDLAVACHCQPPDLSALS
jgi:hypothetical protein